MTYKKLKQTFVVLSLSSAISSESHAQRFLTDVMDTTTITGKGNYILYQQYDKLRFSGYMQPQFQWAESNGVSTFAGGDFSGNSDNRFMLRRGRMRMDYAHYTKEGKPLAAIVFQFDGTERGFFIRDFWGRFYENKLELFQVTTGMFARPMGYELNTSSSDRESPERGRMSQILMKVERDMGIMIGFDSRKKRVLSWLKVDIGIFNGPGLPATTDYDSHKDLIGRIALKPQTIKNAGIILSAGISGYLGGINSQGAILYTMQGKGANAFMAKDSTQANIGKVTPRKYAGADIQVKIPNRKGFTEFRAEYIFGQQTATANSSETPGSYPLDAANKALPLYTRSFDGAYFYFLQHLGTTKLQLVIKYDWYDPNKKVKGKEINAAKDLTSADIRFNTLGSGLVYYINPHLKAQVYYDWVTNESTGLSDYDADKKDNIFTMRLQYRF